MAIRLKGPNGDISEGGTVEKTVANTASTLRWKKQGLPSWSGGFGACFVRWWVPECHSSLHSFAPCLRVPRRQEVGSCPVTVGSNRNASTVPRRRTRSRMRSVWSGQEQACRPRPCLPSPLNPSVTNNACALGAGSWGTCALLHLAVRGAHVGQRRTTCTTRVAFHMET